jgi:hypothetical protein
MRILARAHNKRDCNGKGNIGNLHIFYCGEEKRLNSEERVRMGATWYHEGASSPQKEARKQPRKVGKERRKERETRRGCKGGI